MALRKRSEIRDLDLGDDEDIFGVLDEDYSHPYAQKIKPRKPRKGGNKLKKKKKQKQSESGKITLPLERIDPRAFFLPDTVPRDEIVAHEVSPSTLKNLENGVNTMTKGYSSILLESIVPAIIAVDKAQSYTASVVSDVFGFETEADLVIPEIINDLARLEVSLFYARRMKVSKRQRRLISDKLIDVLVSRIPETITKAEKTQAFSDRIRQLQSVYVKKPGHEPAKVEDQKEPPTRTASVRRRR